jgi:DNA polymerase-3 subunit alpha
MELQQHNPVDINQNLIGLARKHDIKPVVTSDCHYARKEDLWLEEAMLILSTNPDPRKDFDYSKTQKMEMLERFNYAYPMYKLDANGDPLLDENGEPVKTKRMSFQEFELFLHGVEDHLKGKMVPQFGEEFVSECIENTNIVADMIGDYPYHEGLNLLPEPKAADPDTLLAKKAWEGYKKRGFTLHEEHQEYKERLHEELEIIKDKGFSTYFLIEANAVAWAKSKEIMIGPGRGSGAGSLLNYCLGITPIHQSRA